jgi:hypothetical protein
MHLVPGVRHESQEHRSASDLLGSDHPLVRALDQSQLLATQSVVVGALMCAGLVAVLEGVSEGLSIVLAASAVEATVACRAAVVAYSRRERAIDLIVEGRGDLPLQAVARERRRLIEPAHRHRAAASLDAMRADAGTPTRPRAFAWPIYNVRAIRAVAPELAAVARLLEHDDAPVRGVAMAERLVCDGTSSLYRADVGRLYEELRRIRYHLEA